MCVYMEYKSTYNGCAASPKHVITTRKYDTDGCEKFKKSGHTCDEEATPAKGLNGEVI